MFILFTRKFRKHLDHEIQVIYFTTKIILKFAKNIIQLFATAFRCLAQACFHTDLLK